MPSLSVICAGVIFALTLGLPIEAEPPRPRHREQIGEVLGKPVYRDEIRTGKNVHLDDELHGLFTSPVLQKYCREHKAEIMPTEAEITAASVYFEKCLREENKKAEPENRLRLKEINKKLLRPKLTKEEREHLEIERIETQCQLPEEHPELRQELKTVKEMLSHSNLTKGERQHLEFKEGLIETDLEPLGRDFAHFVVDNWKLQLHLYKKFGGGRLLWQQAGIEAFDAMRNWLETQEHNGSFKITDRKLRNDFYHYWHRSHGPFMIEDKDRIRQEFLEPEWAPRKDR